MLVNARAPELPVGGNDVDGQEVIAAEPVIAHQPADAAPQREARDTGMSDDPTPCVS